VGQIYIVHYGTRDTALTPINNAVYAAKVAAGLRRIADMLEDPETEFLTARDFKETDTDNTWLHVSMVTESGEVPPDPGDLENPRTRDIQPRSQFNVHLMIKHVTDENELAEGLTTAEVLGGLDKIDGGEDVSG